MKPSANEVTQLLVDWNKGDDQALPGGMWVTVALIWEAREGGAEWVCVATN